MKENNVRNLLLQAGIGDYNATLAIQFMFMAPAVTDPQMPAVVLMTEALQRGLISAGATDVQVTGRVDMATARALIRLVGQRWNQVPWYELFRVVATAKTSRSFEAPANDLGSFGLMPSLPSVPGGVITYGIVGYLIWKHLLKD